MSEFTQQQIEMFERFKKLKVGALFSQMGTGKTRVAVELVNYNKPDFLLYLCPFSCKNNIERELNIWQLNCDYCIVGYETLSSSDITYLDLVKKLESNIKNFIIADESIFIKNGTTKRFKRALMLRTKCQYALILNGTPIVNNERDIYNQMEFLSHRIFNMSYYQFMNSFFKQRGYRHNGKEYRFYEFYEKNRPAFTKIINPYVYMADLIFKYDEIEHYSFVDFNKRIYDKVRDEILENYMEMDIDYIISMFTLLASVAAEDHTKNDAVISYISNKKCVCYCSRKAEVDYISSNCKCFMINGETNEEDRKRIIKEWEESVNTPLILSFGVGAYSLNLQCANEIVYSSLTFNFGQYEQSKFRIKRLGQEQNIKYTYILADCGITRTMINNLSKKDNLASEIKSQIKKNSKKWLEELI